MAQNAVSTYTNTTSNFVTNAKIWTGKGWMVLNQLKSAAKPHAIVNNDTNTIAVAARCPISRRIEFQYPPLRFHSRATPVVLCPSLKAVPVSPNNTPR